MSALTIFKKWRGSLGTILIIYVKQKEGKMFIRAILFINLMAFMLVAPASDMDSPGILTWGGITVLSWIILFFIDESSDIEIK